MPPSLLFLTLKKTACKSLWASATFVIPRGDIAKLRGQQKSKKQSKRLVFVKTYPGEGKVRVAALTFLDKKDHKGTYKVTLAWFVADSEPPPEVLSLDQQAENILVKHFQEREVDVRAEYSFNKNEMTSVFRPIDLGEQSQILDEIVGFKGVKRDLSGKTLYTLEISFLDKSIELKLNFRQTVRLEDTMPILLLETATKISSLAVKPRETT
jgi:hypothetical protein